MTSWKINVKEARIHAAFRGVKFFLKKDKKDD